MSQRSEYEFLLIPEAPDREITGREALVMTLEFLRSDFYRYVWHPRYVAEMERTDIRAMMETAPNIRLQWLDRRAALRAIKEAWFAEWLNPPDDERKEDYRELIDIEPEVFMSTIPNE